MTFLFCILLAALLLGCGGGSGNAPDVTPAPQPDPPVSASPCDQGSAGTVNWPALMNSDCPHLEDYGLFVDSAIPTQAPTPPGQAYRLTTQLFSDYASKYRFLFLPQGQQIQYQPQSAFDLPVGSVLVKTFALPFDSSLTGAENQVLVETRLLIHRATGWTTLPYQWQQGQARLISSGAAVAHTMTHNEQTLNFLYQIPSRVECKLCHQLIDDDGSSRISPIGLKAHLLNVPEQQSSQLLRWQQSGLLAGLPAANTIARAPALLNSNADLTQRVKGYLDINCAHCHQKQGHASISGLRLGFYEDHTQSSYGICKQPPGWDGGPRGLDYDLLPGNGLDSILPYRMELTEPKDKMPMVGRSLAHTEAIALIRQWIDSLPASLGSCG
ncbi:SO2930 family diheme c-type cytochrome [Ferrimonas kyonanensis]|uniref:SO2930 family diheme c-type cytochrome n=1 Tax=Ferrimonas kyonanensis TaxID=364763 RepID=UPI0003FF9296|nr:SO2930 family diheme c-type cytochrome [Ferrimonas kyonanensis]